MNTSTPARTYSKYSEIHLLNTGGVGSTALTRRYYTTLLCRDKALVVCEHAHTLAPLAYSMLHTVNHMAGWVCSHHK